MRSTVFLVLLSLLTQAALAAPKNATLELLPSKKWGRLYFLKNQEQPTKGEEQGTIININTCTHLVGSYTRNNNEFTGKEINRWGAQRREGKWKNFEFLAGNTMLEQVTFIQPTFAKSIYYTAMDSDLSDRIDAQDSGYNKHYMYDGATTWIANQRDARAMAKDSIEAALFDIPKPDGKNMDLYHFSIVHSGTTAALSLLFPLLPETIQNKIGHTFLIEYSYLRNGVRFAPPPQIMAQQGTFVNGACEGKCASALNNDNSIVANHKNGSLSGPAVITTKDKHKISGAYYSDLPVGMWTHEYPTPKENDSTTTTSQLFRNGTPLSRIFTVIKRTKDEKENFSLLDSKQYSNITEPSYRRSLCTLSLGQRAIFLTYGSERDKNKELIKTQELTFDLVDSDIFTAEWTDKNTEDEIFGTSERDKIALPWRVKYGLYAALLVMLVLSGSFIVFSIRLFTLPIRIMYRTMKTLTPTKKKS